MEFHRIVLPSSISNNLRLCPNKVKIHKMECCYSSEYMDKRHKLYNNITLYNIILCNIHLMQAVYSKLHTLYINCPTEITATTESTFLMGNYIHRHCQLNQVRTNKQISVPIVVPPSSAIQLPTNMSRHNEADIF